MGLVSIIWVSSTNQMMLISTKEASLVSFIEDLNFDPHESLVTVSTILSTALTDNLGK